VALLGPGAYTLATVTQPHSGAIPSAGPAEAATFGPGGGAGGAFGGGRAPTGNRTGARAGGLLEGSTPSSAVVAALQQDADRYTWVAATVGANSASGYQLATDDPVMAIGGFNGTDPSPTLAQFQADVASGQIHWFIAGGGFGGGGGPGGLAGPGGATTSTSSAITAWVEQHFTATTVGGVTMYDLSRGASGP
ncbi:MAG: hypothetical protein QOE63_942, partial [Acidimicrobiaceae bacterium]